MQNSQIWFRTTTTFSNFWDLIFFHLENFKPLLTLDFLKGIFFNSSHFNRFSLEKFVWLAIIYFSNYLLFGSKILKSVSDDIDSTRSVRFPGIRNLFYESSLFLSSAVRACVSLLNRPINKVIILLNFIKIS